MATENQSQSADTGQCRFVQKLCSVLQPVNTLQVTLTSVCASAHSSWDPALSTASPLGQPRLLFIRTTRSEPSILERSSLACSPQSVQYMYLKTDIYIIHHHILYPVLSCTKPCKLWKPLVMQPTLLDLVWKLNLSISMDDIYMIKFDKICCIYSRSKKVFLAKKTIKLSNQMLLITRILIKLL